MIVVFSTSAIGVRNHIDIQYMAVSHHSAHRPYLYVFIDMILTTIFFNLPARKI